MKSLAKVMDKQTRLSGSLKTSTSRLMGSHLTLHSATMPQVTKKSIPRVVGESSGHAIEIADIPTGGSDHSARRGWMPKMDFPLFEGSDSCIWLDKCEAYFALYHIPDDFQVTAASLHLSGRAAHWFQSYKTVVGALCWT